MLKNLPANAGDTRDVALILGLERSPGEGNGNPLQYSFLGGSMDRGALAGCSPWGCQEVDMSMVEFYPESNECIICILKILLCSVDNVWWGHEVRGRGINWRRLLDSGEN